MKKNSYEIIVNDSDYDKVAEILNYLKINYIDEFSFVEMPENLSNDKHSKKYGIAGLALAILGIYLSFLFLYWTQKISYPLNIGGKNLFDLVYSFPVIFEFTVLIVVTGLFVIFIFSDGIFRFNEIHKNKKTIYIENIFNIELIKDKLSQFDVEINSFAKNK